MNNPTANSGYASLSVEQLVCLVEERDRVILGMRKDALSWKASYLTERGAHFEAFRAREALRRLVA